MKIHRLGNINDDKARPLKVDLQNPQTDKQNILVNMKNFPITFEFIKTQLKIPKKNLGDLRTKLVTRDKGGRNISHK